MLLARRGIAQAAYTNSEFLALGDVEGVDVIIDPAELTLDPVSEAARSDGELDSTIATKLRLAQEFAERPRTEGNKRIVFRFLTSPTELSGGDRVAKLHAVGNVYTETGENVAIVPTDEAFDIDTGLVLRAIGYRGVPINDVPFDDVRCVVPNVEGRVQSTVDGDVVPGLYVTGWIKRGATGGIGRNRLCGQETAESVIADFVAGILPDASTTADDVADLVADRGAHRIDLAGWKNIDAVERGAGRSAGRRRVKLVHIDELESASREVAESRS